jgi:hypothetical protein
MVGACGELQFERQPRVRVSTAEQKLSSTVSNHSMKLLWSVFDFGDPFSILHSAKPDGFAQGSISLQITRQDR